MLLGQFFFFLVIKYYTFWLVCNVDEVEAWVVFKARTSTHMGAR